MEQLCETIRQSVLERMDFSKELPDAELQELIAKEMSYSERHILTLHGQALIEFDKKYGSLYRDVEKCS